MSEKKYQLMVDPTPAGWAYGFPRALPEDAVDGTGHELWVKPSFNLTEWVCSFGYPEESFGMVRYYPREISTNDPDEYQGGVENFATYPGGCAQE